MSIASKPKVIIAAIASRAYVQAAVEAGFDIVAIDAFVDVDTQRLAKDCYLIDLNRNQLDKDQLIKVLDGLDLQQFVGFCYGAGFEQTPDVLTQIDKRITVLGNTAKIVSQCKTAKRFFKQCDELSVSYPSVMAMRPSNPNGWIQKTEGGSGGGHIKSLLNIQANQVNAQVHQAESIYYQKLQLGKSISCLFIASEHGAQVIGFSEQWLDSNDDEPFRYGGAVSHAGISEQAITRFTNYVVNLAQAIGLVGINSCDAICDGDDVYVLEINPRLSATMDLYAGYLLMEKHVAACQHTISASGIELNNACPLSNAHQVIYANRPLTVKDDIIWPEWVCDLPKIGNYFSVGMPICTVVAEAETAALAKSLVNERAAALNDKLLN